MYIECKGNTGDESAVDQVLRYRKVGKKNSRYLLIAFDFDKKCRKKANKHGIELFEVDLSLKAIKQSI
ncbi:MAG: hypothetical protein ABIH83_01730 [Candidatus Micrarchaeota archaeon]